MEDVDEASCPLCMEVLDPTDQAFFPCPCRYQVCLWCVHHIREQMNGTCPACRQEYLDENFITDESIKEEALNKAKEKEKEAKEAALKAEQEAVAAAAAGKGPSKADREKQKKKREKLSELATVRVVQRNVIYVMGIAPSIAKAETLRRPEFFGQYGNLLKVAVNRSAYVNYHQRRGSATDKPSPATYAAYLTYATDEDAKSAKDSVDGFEVDGSALRVCFGTTRYCQSFLKDIKCVKPDCTFLHALVESRKKRGGQRVRERERERADRAQQRERGDSDQHSQQNTWNNEQHRDRSAPSTGRRGKREGNRNRIGNYCGETRGNRDRDGSNRGRVDSGQPAYTEREHSTEQQQYKAKGSTDGRSVAVRAAASEQDVEPVHAPPTVPPPPISLSQMHPPTVPPPSMTEAPRVSPLVMTEAPTVPPPPMTEALREQQPALPLTVPPPLVSPSTPLREPGLDASTTSAASGRVQKRLSAELRELVPPAIPPPESTLTTRTGAYTESELPQSSVELRELLPPSIPPPQSAITTQKVPHTESAPRRLSEELRNLTPPPMPPPPIPLSPRLPTTVPKDGPPPPDFAPPPIPATARAAALSAVEPASCAIPSLEMPPSPASPPVPSLPVIATCHSDADASEYRDVGHDLASRPPPADLPSSEADFSHMMTLFANAQAAGEAVSADVSTFVAPEHFYEDFLPYSRVDAAIAPVGGDTTSSPCDPAVISEADRAAVAHAASLTERPLGASSMAGSLYAPLAPQTHAGWNDAAMPLPMNAEPSSPLLPQGVLDPAVAAAAARKQRNGKDKGAPLTPTASLAAGATNGQQQPPHKGSKGLQQATSKQQPKGQRKPQAPMVHTPPDYGVYVPHMLPYTQQPNYGMYNNALRDSWSPQHPQAEQQHDRRRRNNKKTATSEWKPVQNNCPSTEWTSSLGATPAPTTSPHDWNAGHDWKAPVSPSALIAPSSGPAVAGGWKTPTSEWTPDLSPGAASRYAHWSDPWAPTISHNANEYPRGTSSAMSPDMGAPRVGNHGAGSPSMRAQGHHGAAPRYEDASRASPWGIWPDTVGSGENGDGHSGTATHSQGIDLLQSIFPNTKVSLAADDWKPSVADPKYGDNDGNRAHVQPNGDGAPVTQPSITRASAEFSQLDQAALYYGTPFSPESHRV